MTTCVHTSVCTACQQCNYIHSECVLQKQISIRLCMCCWWHARLCRLAAIWDNSWAEICGIRPILLPDQSLCDLLNCPTWQGCTVHGHWTAVHSAIIHETALLDAHPVLLYFITCRIFLVRKPIVLNDWKLQCQASSGGGGPQKCMVLAKRCSATHLPLFTDLVAFQTEHEQLVAVITMTGLL